MSKLSSKVLITSAVVAAVVVPVAIQNAEPAEAADPVFNHARAQDVVDRDIITYNPITIDGVSGYQISKGISGSTQNKDKLHIYSEYKGLPVISVGKLGISPAEVIFEDASKILEIADSAFRFVGISHPVHFENVKRIGASAFSLGGGSQITFGDKLTYIGKSAFSNASIRNTISFPSVEEIGDYAFQEAMIPELILNKTSSLKKIGIGAFQRSEIAGPITIYGPELLTKDMFDYSKFKEINIINTSQYNGILPDNLFRKTTATNSIDFPNVSEIGASSFSGSSFSSINFGDGSKLTKVGASALSSSRATNNLDLPNLSQMGNHAFSNSGFKTLKLDISKIGSFTKSNYSPRIPRVEKSGNRLYISNYQQTPTSLKMNYTMGGLDLAKTVTIDLFDGYLDIPEHLDPNKPIEFIVTYKGFTAGTEFSSGNKYLKDISAPNTPPTISALPASQTLVMGSRVRLDFQATDMEDITAPYEISVTSGVENLIANPSGSGVELSPTRVSSGNKVQIKATDSEGLTDIKELTVNVVESIKLPLLGLTGKVEVPSNGESITIPLPQGYDSSNTNINMYPMGKVDTIVDNSKGIVITSKPGVSGDVLIEVERTHPDGSTTTEDISATIKAPEPSVTIPTPIKAYSLHTILNTGAINMIQTTKSDLKIISGADIATAAVNSSGQITISPKDHTKIGTQTIILEGKDALGKIVHQPFTLDVVSSSSTPVVMGTSKTVKVKSPLLTLAGSVANISSVDMDLLNISSDVPKGEVIVTGRGSKGIAHLTVVAKIDGHDLREEHSFRILSSIDAPIEEMPYIESGSIGSTEVTDGTPPYTDVKLTVSDPAIATAVWNPTTQKIEVTGLPGKSGEIQVFFEGVDSTYKIVYKTINVDIVSSVINTSLEVSDTNITRLTPKIEKGFWANGKVTIDDPTKADVSWRPREERIVLTPKPGATGTANITFKGTNPMGETKVEVFKVTFKKDPLTYVPPIQEEGSTVIAPTLGYEPYSNVVLTVADPTLLDATWNDETQQIDVKGKPGQSGTTTITMEATDAINDPIKEVFEVTVTDDIPDILPPDVTTPPIEEGNTGSIDPDAGGAPYTDVTLSTSPAGLATAVWNDSTQKIDVTGIAGKSGTVTVTFKGRNSTGKLVQKDFTVEIKGTATNPGNTTIVPPLTEGGTSTLDPTVGAKPYTNVNLTVADPSLLDASWNDVNQQIDVTAKPGQSGKTTVTMDATDGSGKAVKEVFEVTITSSTAEVLPPETNVPPVTGGNTGAIDPNAGGAPYTDVFLSTSPVGIAAAVWNSSTQKIDVTGLPGQSGTVIVHFKGRNSAGKLVQKDFTVEVKGTITTPKPPTVDIDSGGTGSLKPTVGTRPYSNVNITVSDPSKATATWDVAKEEVNVQGLPNQTGLVTITFEADDSTGTRVTQTFDVMLEVPKTPTAGNESTLKVEGGYLSLEHLAPTALQLTLDLESKKKMHQVPFNDKLNVMDARGSLDGWTLSVSATQLTEKDINGTYADGSAPHKLDTGSILLTSTTVRNITSATSTNISGITGLNGIGTAVDTGSPIQIGTAARGNGGGKFEFTFADGFNLAVNPADIRINSTGGNKQATYTTTLNWTLVSGPTN